MELDILSAAQIPSPNVVVHTGRGVHLYWCFDRPIPAAAHPRWSVCVKALIELLTPVGADPAVRDSARILRLVGTTNSKAYQQDENDVARQWVVNAETLIPQRWSFDFLADQILPISRADLTLQRAYNTHEFNLKCLAARRAGAPEPLPRSKMSNLRLLSDMPGKVGRFMAKAQTRQADLELLAGSGYPQGVPEGLRDKFLFQSACNLAWFCAPHALERTLLQFKARHLPSLSDEEAFAQAGTALRRAQEAYKNIAAGLRHDIYTDARYSFSDDRLWQEFGLEIERFGLKDRMQAIVPDGAVLAKKRLARLTKRVANGQDTYTGTGIRTSNLKAHALAIELRSGGAKLAEIADAIGKSKKTISVWLKAQAESTNAVPEPPHTTTTPLPLSYPQADQQVAGLPKNTLNNGETMRHSVFSEIQSLTGQGPGGVRGGAMLVAPFSCAERTIEALPAKPRARRLPKVKVQPVEKPDLVIPVSNIIQVKPGISEPLSYRKRTANQQARSTSPAPSHSAPGNKVRNLPTEHTEAVLGLRQLDVQQTLSLIGARGWKVKEDLSFVPKNDKSTTRVHVVTPVGHVFEVVYTDRRWFLPLEDRGGAGAIDLVMAMTKWDFLKVVNFLCTPGSLVNSKTTNSQTFVSFS